MFETPVLIHRLIDFYPSVTKWINVGCISIVYNRAISRALQCIQFSSPHPIMSGGEPQISVRLSQTNMKSDTGRMLFRNSRIDGNEDFVPFEDRNYDNVRRDGNRDHLQLYVETPAPLTARATFNNGHAFSPPGINSAPTISAGTRKCS